MKSFWLYLAILNILVLAACNSPKKSPEKADSQKTEKKKHSFELHLPTIAECEALAKKIEQEMLTELPSEIPEWIDFERLYQLSSEGLEAHPKIKAGNYQGTKNVFKDRSPFHVAQRNMGEYGSFQCIKVYQKDSKFRLLFRLIPEEGGFSYQEFIVERSFDDKCKVVDCYYLAMNETASEMFRRLFVLTKPAAQKDLEGTPEELKQTGDQVDEINQKMKAREYQKVLELFDEASDVVKEIKFIHTMRLHAAIQLGNDEQVQDAFSTYQEKFGKDPGVDFIMMDHYFNQRKFEKVLSFIEKLDKEIGDPFLNYYRSPCYLELGKVDRAKKLADQLVMDFKDIPVAFGPRVDVALHEEDHDKIVEILLYFESFFDWDVEAILEDPIYDSFKKSLAHEKWKASYESRHQEDDSSTPAENDSQVPESSDQKTIGNKHPC